MAWFKREEEQDIPEELKGKSAKEIAELLKKAQEFETEVTSLKTQVQERDTRVTELQNTFNATKTRLDQLEANSRPPERQRTQDEIPSVIEDEEEAFRRRQEPTQAVALHSGMLSARMMAENQVRQQPGGERIWRKYEKEIIDIMNKETPQRRIFPEVWLNAFTYVKGVHFDEVMQSAQKGENLFFSETSSNAPEPAPQKKDDKLTDKEMEIARKMKIDPAKYLEQKKKIQVVS